MATKKVSGGMISIVANSQLYSVSEIVPEEKAEARLEQIRRSFQYQLRKHNNAGNFYGDKLKVSTKKVNPNLWEQR